MDRPHALARYLEESKRPVADLARAVGTSRMSIYRIMRGDQVPSLGLVQKIAVATEGVLDANDFLPPVAPAHPAASERAA